MMGRLGSGGWRKSFRRFVPATCLSVLFLCGHVFPALAVSGVDPTRCRSGDPVRVVAFGDSLTAGYGLAPTQAFPAQLEKSLKARGTNIVVRNAGVSGDTTAAGLARFDWAVPPDTDAVILELGANDALRGQPPAKARANLDEIISRLKARKIAVLVTGMRALRNWGDDYEEAFNPIFADLAKSHDTLFYPFFLEGVALDSKLNLPDGLHPTGEGIAEIVTRISPHVDALIKRAQDLCSAHAEAAR